MNSYQATREQGEAQDAFCPILAKGYPVKWLSPTVLEKQWHKPHLLSAFLLFCTIILWPVWGPGEAVLSLWEIQVQSFLYLFLSKSLLSSLPEGLQVPHSAWWEPSLMSLYHFLLLSFFTLNGTCPFLPWDTKPHALTLMVHRLREKEWLTNYKRCIRSFD